MGDKNFKRSNHVESKILPVVGNPLKILAASAKIEYPFVATKTRSWLRTPEWSTSKAKFRPPNLNLHEFGSWILPNSCYISLISDVVREDEPSRGQNPGFQIVGPGSWLCHLGSVLVTPARIVGILTPVSLHWFSFCPCPNVSFMTVFFHFSQCTFVCR